MSKLGRFQTEREIAWRDRGLWQGWIIGASVTTLVCILAINFFR